jgi:PilZ domain-containing protein
MECFMNHADPERRLIRRHEIKTPLRIRLCKSNGPEQKAESLNLSEYGVCFATDSLIHQGQTVEVVLRMPEEVSGEQSDEWRCTGRVVRVERIESPFGQLSISVRFDCYEVTRTEDHRLAKDARLRQRVTLPIFRRPVN